LEKEEPLKNALRTTLTSLALGALLAPAAAGAASSDHRTFDGTIVHISTNNVKVKGLEGGQMQTLSFLYVPRIGKLTHNGGEVTRDQKALHEGEYVRVMYDQKALGIRHADAIEPYANPNLKMKS
jgi:hypothetical protein